MPPIVVPVLMFVELAELGKVATRLHQALVVVTCPPKTNPKDELGLEQKGGRRDAKETIHIGTDHHQTSGGRSTFELSHDRGRGLLYD